MTASVLWMRRDLRRQDHPALLAAAQAGVVHPLFVIDPTLWRSGGVPRRAWLAATLEATRAAYDGQLTIRVGDPSEIVPAFAAEVGARSVHVSRETRPFGARRDTALARVLEDADIAWVETGTPYAVGPGLVVRRDTDTPYQVFTPWSRAWRAHGWPAPARERAGTTFGRRDDDDEVAALLAKALQDTTIGLPRAGEGAAAQRWREFCEGALAAYDTGRDRPDEDGTTALSPYLTLGVVHPRTLLADLAGRSDPGAERLVTELAWREFYADVLWHHPRSAWHDLSTRLADLGHDEPDDAVDAWRTGTTGYPFVDAGMRQLLQTGWMHNRLRMVTASFLVKDLHVRWQVGARFFLDHLIDGDIASNNGGWQWVAGTGTDAAPYHRIFNPITQGERFDARGDYVRRWVPELRHVPGKAVHTPWTVTDGLSQGYPARIVDHAQERKVSLDRLDRSRRTGPDGH
jgi:deoxyribodipyrimidine photo-lyase